VSDSATRRGAFTRALLLASVACACITLHCSSSGGGASDASDAGAGAADSAAGDGATCVDVVTPSTGDLPDDVAAVLVSKCQTCHASPPKNHAPWPLLSFEDTQKPLGLDGQRRWQRMASVIEPGGSPHMPFGNAPQLTDGELTILRAWFAGCALPIAEGTGHDLGPNGPEHEAGP
jgi:hypothetical protein